MPESPWRQEKPMPESEITDAELTELLEYVSRRDSLGGAIKWPVSSALITNLIAALRATRERLAAAEDQKNGAYRERDQLVAALSKCFPSHLCRHDGEDWEDDWRTIVCIHLPNGQVTWHIHDSELPWFRHLTAGPNHWDGHSTGVKYSRLHDLALARSKPEEPTP